MTHHEKPLDFLADDHLDRGTKEFLKILNASDTPVESLPPQKAREVLTQAQASVKTELSGIEESHCEISASGMTVPLDIVRPERAEGRLPCFVFLHGGGWVLGDYPTHRRLVRDLVVESGCAAVFIDYTPSPEARYPQALDEIYAAVEWMADKGGRIGVESSRMAIAGNSVGGNMAIATALRAKLEHGPHLRAMLLLWPVTDATFDWESYRLYGRERFLTESLMRWMFDQYTTDAEARKEIYLSPLQASTEQLAGLPPTLIEVAENDILRDQAEALGRKLDQAGVDVTTIRYNGTIHDWGMLNGLASLPVTRSLILNSAAMLRYHLLER